MAKAKTVYEDEVDCECGSIMKPAVFNIEGFSMRGWKCKKCGRVDYSDDINLLLTVRKFKKQGAHLKLRKVGDTVVITIPKEIREALRLRPGGDVRMYPIAKNKVLVEVQ